jgi:hypothetical protein
LRYKFDYTPAAASVGDSPRMGGGSLLWLMAQWLQLLLAGALSERSGMLIRDCTVRV